MFMGNSVKIQRGRQGREILPNDKDLKILIGGRWDKENDFRWKQDRPL